MKWIAKHYNELSNKELYDLLALRINVFVVEQNCPYNDLDHKDQQSHHLLGYRNDKLVAYARIVSPGVSYDEPAIGRVVTHPEVRMEGFGKKLMNKAIELATDIYNTNTIRISAQEYLHKFYTDLGFTNTGKKYLEDGIPHQEMLYTK